MYVLVSSVPSNAFAALRSRSVRASAQASAKLARVGYLGSQNTRTMKALTRGGGRAGSGCAVRGRRTGGTVTRARQPARYWAGAGWDKSGDFAGVADWDRYVEQWAKRVGSPLKVQVTAE